MKASRHRISLDGVEVHYLKIQSGFAQDTARSVEGTGACKGGAAPWCALVHGSGCSGAFWSPVLQELEDQDISASFLIIDLPGHGESSKPQLDYTMRRHAGAVLAMLDDAGVESAAIAAHSMGVAVARELVRVARHRVLGLLAVDGYLVMSHPEVGAGFVQYYDSPRYQERFSVFVESLFGDETSNATRELVRGSMLACPQHVMVSQIAGLYAAEVWQPVDFGELPVAFLAAGKTAFPPAYVQQLHREIPQIEYRELPGAGHFLMQDRPAEVRAELGELLCRASAAADRSTVSPPASRTSRGEEQ